MYALIKLTFENFEELIGTAYRICVTYNPPIAPDTPLIMSAITIGVCNNEYSKPILFHPY